MILDEKRFRDLVTRFGPSLYPELEILRDERWSHITDDVEPEQLELIDMPNEGNVSDEDLVAWLLRENIVPASFEEALPWLSDLNRPYYEGQVIIRRAITIDHKGTGETNTFMARDSSWPQVCFLFWSTSSGWAGQARDFFSLLPTKLLVRKNRG